MLLKFSLAIFLLLFLHASFAAPWIEPSDIALRNDIQLLADAGIITAPVTTYPLMWNAIKDDILSAKLYLLKNEQKQALNHVKFSYKYASGHQNITKKSIYLASSANRFTSYGDDNFNQGNISLSQQYLSTNFAGKIQINSRLGLDDTPVLTQGNKLNIDGSFLAYKLGNWVLTAGAIERWWGPGIDTNLIMTTNSRPLPAIAITRDDSNALQIPWLSWIGPWTLTTQIAKLEAERAVPDTLMWSTRATFRPLRGLEIGTVWSLQWAGADQPSSINDFFSVLLANHECADGTLKCSSAPHTKEGNHIAGYDIRWSDTIFDLPYALYLQTIGANRTPNFGIFTDNADMYGMETRFTLFNQRVFANVEYTDTQTTCGAAEGLGLNCLYEHALYQSGYRYYRRTIGSTYDNDAQTLVATFLIQTTAGNSWQLKLRKAQLNTDNIDRYPSDINIGNPVSKVAENVLQFNGQYKFIALGSRFTLGVIITNSKFSNNEGNASFENGNALDAYMQWEYRY
jgi:hypothetical protein